MAEIWFYHLERLSLAQTLPNLLERSLERGWRAVVQIPSEERLAALDQLLWIYSEESFLPHGSARDGDPERQPIFLTCGGDNPNSAQVRFCVEGADPQEALAKGAAHLRVAALFDGRDEDALTLARRQWAALKTSPHQRAYWQANDAGRWEKKA